MESKVATDVIRLNTGSARQSKQALLDLIEYGAQTEDADTKRQLLWIIKDHISSQHTVMELVDNWEGADLM